MKTQMAFQYNCDKPIHNTLPIIPICFNINFSAQREDSFIPLLNLRKAVPYTEYL